MAVVGVAEVGEVVVHPSEGVGAMLQQVDEVTKGGGLRRMAVEGEVAGFLEVEVVGVGIRLTMLRIIDLGRRETIVFKTC